MQNTLYILLGYSIIVLYLVMHFITISYGVQENSTGVGKIVIGIGLDIGSTASKGVLINEGKKFMTILPTGWSPRNISEQLISSLLSSAGLSQSKQQKIFVTGYGRVAIQDADKTITEIKCHARGISSLYPEVRTLIDIGGQDTKVISIDSNGKVMDFAMNDKCAAGTGRFLEVMAAALGMDVSDLGHAELINEKININSMCTVFAESEIIGLLARGASKEGIIAGIHQSVARRVSAMVRRMGINEKLSFTGGVAKNPGVKRALEEELGHELIVSEICQFTGALGAALFACED